MTCTIREKEDNSERIEAIEHAFASDDMNHSGLKVAHKWCCQLNVNLPKNYNYAYPIF